MSNVSLFTPGYVNPYVALSGLDCNVKRPYGFDEKQGIFTTEQAMKDFKPGIKYPEKEGSSTGKKVLKAVGLVAALATAYVFRGKIAAGASKIANAVKPYVQKIWSKTPQSIKQVANKVRKYISPAVGKVSKYVNAVVQKVKPYVSKAANAVKPFVQKATGFIKNLVSKV